MGATEYNGYCGHHQDQAIAIIYPIHSMPRFNACSLTGVALPSASKTLKFMSCPRQAEGERAVLEFQCALPLSKSRPWHLYWHLTRYSTLIALDPVFCWVKAFRQLTNPEFRLAHVVPLPIHPKATSPGTLAKAVRRGHNFGIVVPSSLVAEAPPWATSRSDILQTIRKKRGTTNEEKRDGARQAMNSANQGVVDD